MTQEETAVTKEFEDELEILKEESEPEEIQDPEESEEVDEELHIQIGEDSPPQEDDFKGQPAPDWVKELRRENKELKKQLKSTQVTTETQPAQVTLPPRPRIDDSDIDWDKDLFDKRLDEWEEKKAEYNRQESEKVASQQALEKEWQTRIETHNSKATELKVRDFEEVQEDVIEQLSTVQQGILIEAANNSARVVYALGKNPDQLKQLASIKSPVAFTKAVLELESKMKDVKRTRTPNPESSPRGSASVSGTTNSTLKKLEEEANRTGDYTKLVQYKRQLREKTK